jgi:hypothetical protein
MPSTTLTDKFTTHLRRVETLGAAGIPAPKEWLALRERYDAYRHLEMPACDRLIDVILAPSKTSDMTTWHALAISEQIGQDMPGIQARVDNRVAAAVEARLLELYRPHAQRNYHSAQTRFNEAAQVFTAAAHTVDIQAEPVDMVTAEHEQREAWVAAEALAAKLDAAVPTLSVAAELAGARVDDETGSLLAMCVDTADQSRRALWAAWEAKDGRCGRWAALVATGATLRAADLADIAAYDRPRPLEHRMVPTREHGIYEERVFDPESPDYQPPDAPQLGMIPGRRMVTR